MIRCELPSCEKDFDSRSGYLSHLRAHVRKGDISISEYEQLREGEQDQPDRVILTDREYRRVQAEARRWKRRAKIYEKGLDATDRIVDIVKDSVQGLPPIDPPTLSRREGEGQEEVAVLHLSDVHIGKKTPSYDPDEFGVRLGRLGTSLISIVEAHRQVRPVKRLIIVFGGDKLLCLLIPLIR